MTDKPALPPDAIAIPQAAKLVGLHPERVRQLVRAGYAVSPARGMIRLTSLLSGYVRFLKTEAGRPESEAAARGFDAKAQLIEAATERRRAELLPREEAEQALTVIRDTAVRHLRTLTNKRGAARGLPETVRAKVAVEVEVALVTVNDAYEAAVRALQTGDLTALEGLR